MKIKRRPEEKRPPCDWNHLNPKGVSLPHSEEAEKAILSCCLNDENVVDAVESDMGVEAFYHPVMRKLFDEMLWYRKNSDHPLNVVTFMQHLTDKKMLDECGGPGFIAELTNLVPSPGIYPHYSAIVASKMELRKVIGSCSDILESVSKDAHDLTLMRETVNEALVRMGNAVAPKETGPTWDDEIDSWNEDWEQMATGRKKSGDDTRWRCYNNRVGGIMAGYSIISGTSSSGKSTLLGNILTDACIHRGRPGLFKSYEMPVRTCIGRLVADIGDVDGKHIFAPDRSKPSKEITRRITDAMEKIRKSKLRIIHDTSMGAEDVCRIAREMFLKHGDLIMGVDYVQLIKRPSWLEKGANREREVATNSSIFRNFSKEIDRPVIALSQLNNDGTTRESASVNMDCDSHLRIDRIKDKNGNITESGVFVAKSRNGEADFHLPLFLQGERFRFIERDAFPD